MLNKKEKFALQLGAAMLRYISLIQWFHKGEQQGVSNKGKDEGF